MIKSIEIHFDKSIDVDDVSSHLKEDGYINLTKKTNESNSLGTIDPSILEIVLTSSVAASIVTGIFNSIRDYLNILVENKKIENDSNRVIIKYKAGQNEFEVITHLNKVDEVNALIEKIKKNSVFDE